MKRGTITFIAGVLTGAAMFGGTAAAAAGIIANLSTDRVYVNGSEIKCGVYKIEGANYFKLRDIGEAFDFGVDWDDASKTIAIDTGKGYTPG